MALFDKPRGTRDFLPAEMTVRNHVETITRRAMELYGFQQIQTPIFEQYELLSARSGDEIRESLFTFASDAGRYALRPELTSPVCRLLASDALSELPLPYKLYYFGPCFRYCRPQAARYREFYQVGVELMGTSDVLADAEVIALAVSVLKQLGIDEYQLRLGDVGVFRQLLEDEDTDERRRQERQNRIISDVDKFTYVREKCDGIADQEEVTADDRAWLEAVTRTLRRLQDETSAKEKTEILSMQLEQSNEQWQRHVADLPDVAESTFRASWVFHRILSEEKASQILEVARIRGDCASVMEQARAVLTDGRAMEPLQELVRVCEWLSVLGVTDYEVMLGTARNLDFYTGTVFEIYTPLIGGKKQLCGGGRYDKLVEDFDGPPTPATGFAFGFDRLVEAFRATHPPMSSSAADVVIVSDTALRQRAVETAQRLRGHDLRVIVPSECNDEQQQMSYSKSLRARVSVVLLDDEQCRLINHQNNVDVSMPLADVAREIQAIVEKG